MTNRKINYSSIALLTVIILFISSSCKRDFNDLEPATYPTTAEVFIDGFSAGLDYSAYGDSYVSAFQVDEDVSYKGTASMRFDVPDADSPKGSYAGGEFVAEGGRNLSGYNALTFWAKASQGVNIGELGFSGSGFRVSLLNAPFNTTWKQYIIPIPDPSKLTLEKVLFSYAATPLDGKGYSFWIDEVKYEKLGTLANPRPAILEGQDQVFSAETGDKFPLGGLSETFSMPNGVDQRIEVGPGYFKFTSSETSVANVNNLGVVSVIDAGTAVITATLAGIEAAGSFTLESTGEAILPLTTAPTPTVSPDSVISMFSNAYTDVPIDTWNTGWQFSTAELTDLKINGDDVKRYKKLNFVGIEFSSQTINATQMTHFHMDIWTPDVTDLPAAFKVLLVDFGPNGTFDGGDDSSHEVSFTSPTLATETWVSLDIPMSSFAGLASRAHLAQLVLSGDLPTVFVDNVYFYNSGSAGPTGPTVAAPTPTQNPADVISIFSDAYANEPGTDFNPNWGQATVVSQVLVDGNNTLLYSGLNYQGIQLGSNQDVSGMTHLHLDVWTANSTALNVFLISPGPVETPYALSVPTSGWASLDIPLTDFDPVDLADLIQFKFDGNGDIYLDNLFFYNDAGGGTMPTVAAPTPTFNPGDVISVFSDAYTNIAGTDLNPNWGQATVVTQELIAGNNTLVYTGLNYQGIQLGSNQDVSGMTHLHLDVWTANSTALNVYLISPGPVETPYALTVPTSGWASVDIPLTDFDPVDLADLIQFKFEGNGDIYLDNIFFHN